jgi:DNA-binding CsgD family transcriptional regulator
MKRAQSHSTLLQLIESIYHAALQTEQWPAVIGQIARHFNCPCGALFLEDMERMSLGFSATHGFETSTWAAYHQHYILQDPGYHHLQTRPLGKVSATNLRMTERELEKLEFYYDFLRKAGIYYCASSTISNDKHRWAVLGIERPKQAGGYSAEELRELEGLFPHLTRAFQIMRRMADAGATRQAVESILEHSDTGALLLDALGRIAFMNRRALELLRASDGLRASAGGLQADDENANRRLAALIHEAIQTALGQGTHAGGGLLVPRPSGADAYRLLVTPLRTEQVPMETESSLICAAVFLREAEQPPALNLEALRDLFALAPAEARVAAAIARGRSPEQIARDGGTSAHTVRSQLRTVYDKVGVHRQAELVTRLLTSPAAQVPPPADAAGDD